MRLDRDVLSNPVPANYLWGASDSRWPAVFVRR